MGKKDLVDLLTLAFPGVSKTDMWAVVDALFRNMAEGLTGGEAIDIRGFGRLSVRKRRPKRARNPRSGESVQVPTRWTTHFKPSGSFTEEINSP